MANFTNTYRTKAGSEVITIPAGKTQRDEFLMDSPTIEPVGIHISKGGMIIDIKYTYVQGSLTQSRLISTSMTEEEVIAILGQTTYDNVITKVKQLVKYLLENIPETLDKIEEGV